MTPPRRPAAPTRLEPTRRGRLVIAVAVLAVAAWSPAPSSSPPTGLGSLVGREGCTATVDGQAVVPHPRAGHQRRDHRGGRHPARPPRAGHHHRPGDGLPGVRPAEPRRGRPRQRRALPAAPFAGLGDARAGHRPRLRSRAVLRRPRQGRRLPLHGDHGSRPGGPAQRVPQRLRRPRGRRPRPRLGAVRQLEGGVLLLGPCTGGAGRGGGRLRADPRAATPYARRWREPSARSPSAASSPGGHHRSRRGVGALRRPGDRHLLPAYDDPANTKSGWALAHWLVANADRLALATVIYDDHIWSAEHSAEGWRPYVPADQSEDKGTAAIQRHLDHVHVDVLRGT